MKTAFSYYLSVTFVIACLCCLLMAVPAVAQPAETPASPNVPQQGAPDTSPGNGNQLVSIDFNNVDIGVFIKFISDLTKRNFVVDDKVRGKVTIISPGRITVAEAYKVFESVLEVYGFTAIRTGEITKIVPSPDARSKNIKTRLQAEAGASGDTIVTQIIPLRYADPNEIKNLFTPLISRNSIIQSYPPTNTLIVTDVQSNIQRLLHILKAIDTTGVGQQIAIIPVENANSVKLVTLLQAIFKSTPQPGKGAAAKDVTFVADERTNVVVVMATEGEVDNIRKLIRNLDQETPRGQGNINVYYLEHASAEDLAKVLQDIPQKEGGAPNQEGKPTAPAISGKVRIAADKATNSLIITADAQEYQVLEEIIKKIDIPRAMVYIEALIMEVNASKNFQLGTQWQVGEEGSHDDKGFVYGGGFKPQDPLISGTVTGTTITPSLPSGFSLGIFGEALDIAGITFPSISAVIQAYRNDRDARILSTPQILTTDNQEAKIYVGRNVPFQTTATLSSSSAGEVYNSFEYRDVGKTLKITPQISKDRMVRLVLSLEVTALESAADNRPITLKRTVDTTAIVHDGHTVVLGGLIDDTDGNATTKVPCLGDIPGFGYLFRTKSTSFDRSNLYIFLTPRVIQNPDEANKVSSNKRNEIVHTREENINLYEQRERPILEHLRVPGPPPQNNTPGVDGENDALPPRGSLDEDSEQGGIFVASSGQGASDAAGLPAASDAQSDSAAPDKNIQDAGAPPTSSPPTAQERNKTPASKANAGPGKIAGYTLQVISLQDPEKANEILDQLNARGYAAYTVRMEEGGAVWYRVRVGYFPSKKESDPIMDRLRGDQFNPLLIKL